VKKSLRRSECEFVIDARLQASADSGTRIHEIDIDRSLWLAKTCQNLKLPMMLLSVAAVYAGRESRGYREEDYPDGESSLAELLTTAEAAARDHCERHVILRMGPVFSPHGISSLSSMLNQLHEQGALTLSRQRRGCPVPAEDGARVVSAMIDQYSCGLEAWGIYHYCSSDITNCYEFAEVLLASASQYTQFDRDEAGMLTAQDEGESLEFRLDCSKLRDTFAIKQQSWRSSAAGQVKQYYTNRKDREETGGESYGHRDASA
jgi:dTDP-4-dehydrorhamnose reductase